MYGSSRMINIGAGLSQGTQRAGIKSKKVNSLIKYPHKMYSKTGKMVIVKTEKEHDRLEKLGYSHSKSSK
jgi:hypothetical protein